MVDGRGRGVEVSRGSSKRRAVNAIRGCTLQLRLADECPKREENEQKRSDLDTSHHHALAAASILVGILHAHLFRRTAGPVTLCAARAAGDLAIVFADLPNDVVEGVFDVDA